MRRIKERRYGRGLESVPSITGTHRIKIGWKTKSRNDKDIPCKLNGFLICRNRLDRNGRPEIDAMAMQALGHSPEQVERALKEHFNAPDGCLPDTLHFVVMRDAHRGADGAWRYPNTLAASYQLYGKEGLSCIGDGCTARRKQDDGTQKEIECVPYGKEGAKKCCPFSGPGKDCRDKFYFAACLFHITPDGPRPLFPDLGMNSLAVFETTSEYCDMDAFDGFDSAADRLKGNLCGITGTLRFGKRQRRTGSGAAVVGHVYIALDEESILQRERMLRGESAIGRTEILSISAGHSIPAIEHKPSLDSGAIYPECEAVEEEHGTLVCDIETPKHPVPKSTDWDEADGALADEEEAAPAEVYPEKAEAVEQLIKMADSADVDLLPILKKAGVEVPDELSLDQIQKTMAWLSRQLDKRLAGVAK